ncbi:ATP-binding protein [Candidatus Saccharibacteria bacterium]|nr:ATP-binding protein [Candidatus Saccharibacteria bacterium]
MYEVFLTRKMVSGEDWRGMVMSLAKLQRQGERAEVIFAMDGAMMRIYLKTSRRVPEYFSNVDGFCFRETSGYSEIAAVPSLKAVLAGPNWNIVQEAEKLEAAGAELAEVHVILRKLGYGVTNRVYLVIRRAGKNELRRVHGVKLEMLGMDLRRKYVLRRAPKYLNLAKTISMVSEGEGAAVMKVNTYPYLAGEHYVGLSQVDFYKHTAVFGASGSGKTKYLAKFVTEIAKNYGEKYHTVVIDPHDALRDEIGGHTGVKVMDYASAGRGVDLFAVSERDILASVEMTKGLIKGLIGEGWNARLERLVTAVLYLLIERSELSFQNMRRVLTDAAYRNAAVKEVERYLPESVLEFYGQDFNELKTQWYDATFARMLALIDELAMTPAFYRKNERRLDYEIAENKVTLISLSQTRLGEKGVKTIAGLIMNQVFTLAVAKRLAVNVLLVVDEVAVVENPILVRMLAEARKYGVSIVVAGQYFAQVSQELREAIFANVANYVCFRLNRGDAELLAPQMEIELADTKQLDAASTRETFGTSMSDKVNLIARLSDREMVVRWSRSGMLMPAVSGRSLDFAGVPEPGVWGRQAAVETTANAVGADAGVTDARKPKFGRTKSNMLDLMREQSTSRKMVN